jgi:UDP-glucose 4-epimerase
MSVVIIGGVGFIGGKLVRCFFVNSEHVLVPDNLCRGHREY